MSENSQLKRILEGAILAAGRSLSVEVMLELFEEGERPPVTEIRAALKALQAECEGRGIELKETASGYRYQAREELAPWLVKLWEERPARYSRATLETLALIAYRQPITRAEIEEVRGVTVSSNIVKSLLEREWIRVVGHRDVPGRPALFATTRHFLDYFNLKSLDQLPSLMEIKDIDSLNASLDLPEPGAPADEGSGRMLGGQDPAPETGNAPETEPEAREPAEIVADDE
ncbi:MAG: SMC-Scp complex subunit ScpB [Gammaproteobacteria bacterium]|nr:SMC-Scp complex subunit ScpB [Gammaproteobacteria bacterium]